MKTIYEKVEEKGLRIPIELCRLADISNEVVIKLYKGKIEICPQFILKEDAEKCYGYLDRKHTLYLYKASRTHFYVKEEPGDGSILSPNYLSTANILVRTG